MATNIKLRLVQFQQVRFMIGLYVLLALLATAQAFWLTNQHKTNVDQVVTRYNNYVIFKQSHHHLLEGKELYREYPEEHWDLYKYTPTFALFFGGFAWLPDWLGLALWNLLNVSFFLLAIRLLPGISEKQKWWILLLSVADVMGSLQNSQSNVLMAGLLILGVALLEKRSFFLAILCIVATFYIKIFGLVALILLLFYPQKVKNTLYAVFWLAILWILPVLITGFSSMLAIHEQYFQMLKNDQSASLGISVLGWLNIWFGINLPKSLTALAGLAVVGISIVRWMNKSSLNIRLLLFSALMVWMVIFNHKAESPTFIIATAAIYIWFFTQPRSWLNILLISLVIIFTSLSATDLFPPFIRKDFFEPYVIKVVPCILVWIRMIVLLEVRMNKINEVRMKV